jgi:hypothetical protein
VPLNVFVIDHEDGLVLFDTGIDPAAATDPDYWPDAVTRWFMNHIFRFDVKPEDRLATKLEQAGQTQPTALPQSYLTCISTTPAGFTTSPRPSCSSHPKPGIT